MEHPSNAPGDFYVEHDCCTSCEVPIEFAPDHFAYDETGHCFVSGQPTTLEETHRMIEVTVNQELDCIRYKGCDPTILAHVEAQLCDETPEGAKSLRRKRRSARHQPRWWQFWRRV